MGVNYSKTGNYFGTRQSNFYDDYDDYGYSYSGYKKGGYYGGGYSSGWSWNTWTSKFDDDDDENENLTIKVFEGYSTPSKRDLKYSLHYSNRSDENTLEFGQELCRFFYAKLINDKNYISKRYSDESLLKPEELNEFLKKKEMFEKLWETDIPGWTPKEKAVYVLEEMSKQSRKGGQPSVEELLETDPEHIKICMDDYWDPIYNELLDELEMKGKGNKLSILKKVSLIKEFGGKFKIEKEIDEKVVSNSHISAKRMMREFSQIYGMDLYQKLFPNFKQRLATKDLVVNVPIDKTEHKQKIIMLVDYSGSMNETVKQEWVCAILLERLKHVIKEECEIFFSFFLHERYSLKFTHLYNRETALEFWRHFSTRPSGGDTQLGVMVNNIKKEIDFQIAHDRTDFFNIKADFRIEQPEILAINDGQDTVKTNSFTYKTNAINLIQNNDEVKELCLKNNGVHVFVDHQDKLTITQ